jgi:hypothetical protein
MSLAELIADAESITFYRLFFMKFLSKSLFQSNGTKTPSGIRMQSLCHIGIAGGSFKHNILSGRVLGEF